MTYEDLVDFLDHKMRMSQIYQPLLIRSLVDAGGSATIRQLAQVLVSHDESQLLYYEKRIKEMPVKVLKKRDVILSDGELVSLNLNFRELTLEQKSQIRILCEQKLQKFIQKRGLGIWDHRLLETNPVPDSLRYQVLKASNGRCALCGCTEKDRPLDVDHILPRSRGGSNDISNLQVLCSKCNRSKGNKCKEDFRQNRSPESVDGCVFCSDEIIKRKVAEYGAVFAVEDKFPVTKGHLLVIPRRHVADYFSMSEVERSDATELIRVLKNELEADGSEISGFNVGMNCGVDAGQSVLHAHIHLIPRRKGDVSNPKGGVRGCVPGKMGY